MNFNRDRHVRPLERNPDQKIILSSDFNCNPLASLVAQIYKDHTGKHRIHILKEILLKDSRTVNLIDFIKKNYSSRDHSMIEWTGDSTGKNPHTSSTLSNWEQINNAFNLGRRLKVPPQNPNVLTSLEDLDYMFYAHPDISIDPSCTQLIFELEYTQKNEKGIIKDNRSDDAQKADLLDCLRYLVNTYCIMERNIRNEPIYFGLK